MLLPSGVGVLVLGADSAHTYRVSFICTGTFSRQSGVRTSRKVSSGGHADGYGSSEYFAFIPSDLLYFLLSFHSYSQVVHSDALHLLNSFA